MGKPRLRQIQWDGPRRMLPVLINLLNLHIHFPKNNNKSDRAPSTKTSEISKYEVLRDSVESAIVLPYARCILAYTVTQATKLSSLIKKKR